MRVDKAALGHQQVFCDHISVCIGMRQQAFQIGRVQVRKGRRQQAQRVERRKGRHLGSVPHEGIIRFGPRSTLVFRI